MALQSKISQLPRKVRDELNRRLDDGQLSPEILPWVNALPETKELVKRKFKDVEVSNQNLSEWRETGYSDWQDQQKELHFIRGAVEFSKDVVRSTGLQLTEGAAAIAAGSVLTRIEDIRRRQQLGEDVAEEMDIAIESINTLRTGEIKRDLVHAVHDRNQLHRDKGERESQKLSLDREKFELAQAKAVLKHAQSREVQDIVKGPGSNADKIAALRRRMFPQRTGPLK